MARVHVPHLLAVAAVLLLLSACRQPIPPATPAIQRSPTGNARFVDPEAPRTAEVQAAVERAARAEAVRLGLVGGTGSRLAIRGESWVNVGPGDSRFAYNDVLYAGVDAGRAAAIAVDPRDPDVVYLATSGGGVWKTWEFERATPNPAWRPITESLGNLSIGGMALDPTNPDVIYVSTGDPFDVPGATLARSSDGGGTWTTVDLAAATGFPVGFAWRPSSTRDVKVDPTDPRMVLVSTDVGLLRSTDGGATFTLVDLPNADAERAEATWRIAYLGSPTGAGGSSRWAVSGLPACEPGTRPPSPGAGRLPGSAGCSLGNVGDIWTSDDAGRTWASARAAGRLPGPPAGRITVAAGGMTAPDRPAPAVLYAMAGGLDEIGGVGAIWRSSDGGATWVDAAGFLANPVLSPDPRASGDCPSMDVGGFQAWYDQAIAVDPKDPDHVIVGGQLCAARTLNGTAAEPNWELVSHWLPQSGTGSTADGPLPYVHADWHTILVSNFGAVVRVFSGNDGGLYSSTDVFSPSVRPGAVTWTPHNRGLVTHLCFGVGSGDPADGNPGIVLTGMQDNGTRFRDASSPTTFNQILGGDGIGTAVGRGANGGEEWYWASLPGQRLYCRPSQSNCEDGASWKASNPPLFAIDAAAEDEPVSVHTDTSPFMVRFAPVRTVPSGAVFLSYTNTMVYQSDTTPTWTQVPNGGPFAATTDPVPPSSDSPRVIRAIQASPSVPGLYGVALSGGHFAVTGDAGATPWAQSAAQIGVGARKLRGTSSIDFPPVVNLTPACPGAGSEAGRVYVVSSVAYFLEDGSAVPPEVGHVFVTCDGGGSFRPLNGTQSGTGPDDLPNVAVSVVRFDPGDPSGSTIYVGTDLGVYRTRDGGASWQRFGNGLPLVRVTDLFVSRQSDLVRASTYGRGIWEIYSPVVSPGGPWPGGIPGDGDYDRNLLIDWRDLGALASRIGTTPSTVSPGPPTYVWHLDLVIGTAGSPSGGIDDADLAALIARFGGHP